MADGMFRSLRGAVETLEQKSGLNPLLFLDAIFGIPGIGFYAWSGKAILLAFVWVPLLATVLFYGVAFFLDRNFLRSEKHVRELKQLELLGEKGKELPFGTLDIAPTVAAAETTGTPTKNPKQLDGGEHVQ